MFDRVSSRSYGESSTPFHVSCTTKIVVLIYQISGLFCGCGYKSVGRFAVATDGRLSKLIDDVLVYSSVLHPDSPITPIRSI